MSATARRVDCGIDGIDVRAYRIPTQTPESDGTLRWNATTLVYVEVRAGGETGIGYTYADASTAKLVETALRDELIGKDALQTSARWDDMYRATRNLGCDGITSMAVSAVDVALWDLKAKMLGAPAYELLGAARGEVAAYGSGGFTSYSEGELCEQLRGWAEQGLANVKMKVGRQPDRDPARVAAARRAVGDVVGLFVDANGAYSRTQALALARSFAEQRVTWFEEPVFREDYEGTRLVRERVPVGMDVSSGEYGYGLYTFARMLDAGCVDVLQADATRCGGFTGLLAVDGLCQTKMMPLSTHCAPHLHLHAAMACRQLRHVEYFFDHVRIECMLFDGANGARDGVMTPDPSRHGIGLELKRADAERYAI